jgi:RNA polymerase sigma-70 factor (ECF subfamily)
MDERDAIEHLRRGDIRGLESLVRTHQVRAIRSAYLVTRDVALAQDIVQAAFVRAYEGIAQLDPDRPFAPWFVTGVVNAAIRAAARRDRHVSFERWRGSPMPAMVG